MSFLSYLALRLLGEPCCDECWSWPCPFCAGGGIAYLSSLVVRPGDTEFECQRCGACGDEVDLVEQFCRLPTPLAEAVVEKLHASWRTTVQEPEVRSPFDEPERRSPLAYAVEIDLAPLETILDRIQEQNGERYRRCLLRRYLKVPEQQQEGYSDA
jgi:hypothetical protein